MRVVLIALCLLGTLAVALPKMAFAQALPEPVDESKLKLETPEKQMSYAIGVHLGTRFHGDGITLEHIDLELLVQGIRDVLEENELSLHPQGIAQAMMSLQQMVSQGFISKAADNKALSEDFLKKNLTNEGMQSTESGLQYSIVREGSGDSPGPTSRVKVNYEGMLVTGVVFDSSYSRGEPATFSLDEVIPGWTEGLQLMKPGAHYRLFVPSELAYGERGQGPIPPNSALIFEVELLEVL